MPKRTFMALSFAKQEINMDRDISIQLESIKIPITEGVSLSGLVGRPQKFTNCPIRVLILVHGFAAEKTENGLFSKVADDFTRDGYFVIMYDWRGLGESDGDFLEANLEVHINDFKRVVCWSEEFTKVSRSGICAVGFSLGATVVARAIAGGLNLGAASFWSPAIRPAVTMWPRYNTDKFNRQLALNGFIVKPENHVRVGKAILDSLRDTDLRETAFELNIPLLVCHGSSDTRIPISGTREAFEHIKISKKKSVCFAEFIGASHSFRPEEVHWDELVKVLSMWLTKKASVSYKGRELFSLLSNSWRSSSKVTLNES